MKILVSLLSILFLLIFCACDSRKNKNFDNDKFIYAWDSITLKAIASCSNSFAVDRATSMVSFIQRLGLRDSVVRNLKDFLKDSDRLYLIEREDGDPRAYEVLVMDLSSLKICVFYLLPDENKLIKKILLPNDEGYKWYSKSFDSWDDFKNSTLPEQRVFLCDEPYIEQNPEFRISFVLSLFR